MLWLPEKQLLIIVYVENVDNNFMFACEVRRKNE